MNFAISAAQMACIDQPVRVALSRDPHSAGTPSFIASLPRRRTMDKPLARLMPFWVVIAVVIVLRLTILEKSGHYAGQYARVHDIGIILAALSTHLNALHRALSYAYTQGFEFLGRLASTVLVLVAVALFGMFGASTLRTSWLLKSPSSVRNTGLLMAVGAAIAVWGAPLCASRHLRRYNARRNAPPVSVAIRRIVVAGGGHSMPSPTAFAGSRHRGRHRRVRALDGP